MDLLGKAGELLALLSASSNPDKLDADTDGCNVGDGENPGIPNMSKLASSRLDSEAWKQ